VIKVIWDQGFKRVYKRKVKNNFEINQLDMSACEHAQAERRVMSKKELLINEIEQVPEPFLDEVLDFIRFLKTKAIKERMNIAIASESSLKKDWLKPEEDEAWQNL